MNNSDIYANEFLDEWSNKNHFLDSEKYLFKKYLVDKDANILEAGTGGGRLAFHLEKLLNPNKKITSFDIVPQMIERAKLRAEDENSNTDFLVADACDLSQFKNESFSYLLYLQQVLCFIENEDDFNKALKETYRLTQKNGIVLFSFLDYETRSINPLLSLAVNKVRFFRKEAIKLQHLPWIKIGKKINFKLFHKNQATCYWVKKNEIVKTLKGLGYEVLEVINDSQVRNRKAKRKSMLKVVCKKP